MSKWWQGAAPPIPGSEDAEALRVDAALSMHYLLAPH